MRLRPLIALTPIALQFRSVRSLSMSYRGGRGRGGSRGGNRGGGGGRGEYYKNKYGRGVRGGGGRGQADDTPRTAPGGGLYSDLINCLERLDGKSYGAYHDLDTPLDRGWVNSDFGFSLFVERAQSDPFAAPTRCRIIIDGATAAFPVSLYSNRIRSVALSDYLLRALHANCKKLGADEAMGGKGWSGPKGGDMQVLEPCQHVLEQSAVRVDERGNVVVQMSVNLPARGRNILGLAAKEIFAKTLPSMIEKSLLLKSLQAQRLQSHVDSIEDQVWLQKELESKNLIAFLRNGALLPRISGVDDRPMDSQKAVPFESPQRLEVSFRLPNAGTTVTGMGIPKGISLICGGGFHGKSTLLQALQVGVYPKIPGDGREFCVTSPNAMKIRAEDGRNIQSCDISSFINNLPFGKDTACFDTADASGSTSQAANIVEAIEIGANTLLLDEDTCATNFMIRDSKMMQLVAPDKEPITPFVSIVRSLYDEHGISTVLVVGGAGDFFEPADNVLVLDCYKCNDMTQRAKEIVVNAQDSRQALPAKKEFRAARQRSLIGNKIAANGKVKVLSQQRISYGESELDISFLEQVVVKSQSAAILNGLQYLSTQNHSNQTLKESLLALEKKLDSEGLSSLTPAQFNGGMSRVRMLEIGAAVNRLRRPNTLVQGQVR
ncbi:unnamed protein product [Cylindrotheca closterium]|uniref:ABC transporter domain-containing protein n=1 Tax=Cylindrotheca closterium TaxID=2856 RepID=A0AAD2CD16_9STRA|nr:unnamed protein product [Cylindrotheca closterium]